MSNSGIFPYLRREAKLEPLTRVARPLSEARPAFISSILRGTNSVQNLSGAYVPFALSTETLVERTIGHLAPIAVHCRDDARLAPVEEENGIVLFDIKALADGMGRLASGLAFQQNFLGRIV